MLTRIANKVIVFNHGYMEESQISEFLALLQRYSSFYCDDDGKDRMSWNSSFQRANFRTISASNPLKYYFFISPLL